MNSPKLKRFPAQLPVSPSAQGYAPRPIIAQPRSLVESSELKRPTSLGLDYEPARQRMLSRIAEEAPTESAVMQAMLAVPRHAFVDSALASQAYEDTSLPIGHGQTISKPSVVARMLSLLYACPLVAQGRVLEIGTGCAYQAAVLGAMCAEAYSMERIKPLHEKARSNLHPLRLKNVHLILGDGMLGYPKGAPYAGIISAAGGEILPQTWIDQLAVGGRLVAPTQIEGKGQAIVVIDRLESGIRKQLYESVHFVPLKSGLLK